MTPVLFWIKISVILKFSQHVRHVGRRRPFLLFWTQIVFSSSNFYMYKNLNISDLSDDCYLNLMANPLNDRINLMRKQELIWNYLKKNQKNCSLFNFLPSKKDIFPNESKKLNAWISQTDKLEQQQIDSEMNYIRSNITTNSNPSVKDEVQVFDRLDETNDETKNSSMKEQERPNWILLRGINHCGYMSWAMAIQTWLSATYIKIITMKSNESYGGPPAATSIKQRC